jgi:hypothetical protein
MGESKLAFLPCSCETSPAFPRRTYPAVANDPFQQLLTSQLPRNGLYLLVGRRMYTLVHLASQQPPASPRRPEQMSRASPPAFPERWLPRRQPSQQVSFLAKSKHKFFVLFSLETVFSTQEALVCNEVTSFLRICILNSPGTGKSVLLREIINTLRKTYVKSPDAVAITASTGAPTCKRYYGMIVRLSGTLQALPRAISGA